MMTAGPRERYHHAVKNRLIEEDSAQLEAVEYLQQLYDELVRENEGRRTPGWWPWRAQRPGIRGLYFWGGVGRGKTYLMDLFYESLPFEGKSRTHFHRFMRGIHYRLKELQGRKDPLKLVAAELTGKARVLCFDEFFVSDIGDAMILGTLLQELFSRGLVLVATSNTEPCNLYRDGLQRRKFLPAIDLIERHTRVLNVDGGTDYRLRALVSAEIYHHPLDEQADRGLQESFEAVCPGEWKAGAEITIEGRPIESRYCGDGVAWFEFSALCDGPRSQNDYIELSRLYSTVLVSGVPRFGPDKEDQARRFITLVDEFYDRNVKLILSAEVLPADLYRGERLNFEFQRTVSRLQEMQSVDYLSTEHRP